MSAPDVLVIRLDAPHGECQVCGEFLPHCHFGLPMFEDLVLHNGWSGEWAGFDACEPCFRAQVKLTEPMPIWEFREARQRESDLQRTPSP